MLNHAFTNILRPLDMGPVMTLRNKDVKEFSKDNHFPPFNIISYTEKDSVDIVGIDIELAVAGYSRDELSVSLKTSTNTGKKLTISGKKTSSNVEGAYLHRGIANRSFVREFTIQESLELSSVRLKDGMLIIKFHVNQKEENEIDIQIN